MRIPPKTGVSCLTVVLSASAAMAQGGDDDYWTPTVEAPPSLPPPRAEAEQVPPAASPAVPPPPSSVVDQTAIDDHAGYGRAGVLELGGSAGLMLASDFRNVTLAPSIGRFIADRVELSAIIGVSNLKAGAESATLWSTVAEGSYHLPLGPSLFGCFGLGIGAAYEKRLGMGLAVAPRLGANVLVGRSGILTPSLVYQYITHNSMADDDVAVVALTSALSVNVGYTTMW